VLTVDVGNTYITVGGVTGDHICFIANLSASRTRTTDEFCIDLKSAMEIHRVDRCGIEGAIISSVVPNLIPRIKPSIQKLIRNEPLVVGPGMKTGLNIRLDNPGQLGSGMVVGAVAALNMGLELPLIIIDMGTATTISVIDSRGSFLGGQIFPGVVISHDALTMRTSQLPAVSLEAPQKVIGRNTVDCMKSGLIYGHASMLDGMVERIEEELGERATVIATGEGTNEVIPYCRRKDIINEPNLAIKGLKILYDNNKRTK
ncbi:MAG: type III pantothenate kinase, partial [Oscillospiraceae bacterium]|nr:type III pantothenate kinase [Oscillospiraceae bacterium]